MRFREKWIEAQRRVLAVLDEETYPFGREETEELKSYLAAYDRTFPSRLMSASPQDILARAAGSAATIVGDYHTHPGSANLVLWLLERLGRGGRPLHVFLEALPEGCDQEILAYQRGKLPEKDLLGRVGYRTAFGFDWALYRPIVRAAFRLGAPVHGINTRSHHSPGLKARDAFAAAVIAERLGRSRGGMALVLAGEKHLAAPHLPAKLWEALAGRGLNPRVTVVHRNATAAYFRLLARGYDGSPLSFTGPAGQLYLQDQSPITLKARDLAWFSRESGLQLHPGAGDEICSAAGFDEVGLFSAVLEAMSALLPLASGAAASFQLFVGPDLSFLERVEPDGIPATRRPAWRKEVARRASLYLPGPGIAWMREVTARSLGKIAALHAAAGHQARPCQNPRLDALRGTLGAALLDPFAARPPLIPLLHAGLRQQEEPEGPPAAAEGARLGRKLFRALVNRAVPLEEVQAIFVEPRGAPATLDRLARLPG